MTKYEEMCALATAARKNWLDTRTHCRQHMLTLVRSMNFYYQIPEGKVKFLSWNQEENTKMSFAEHPEQGKDYTVMGAMEFDDDGFCWLGLRIVLVPSGNLSERSVTFAVHVSDKDGKVSAKLAGNNKPYPIDFNDPGSSNVFYDLIFKEVQQAFAGPRSARSSAIGFKLGASEDAPESLKA